MNDLEMYLGCEPDTAQGWMYDDGIVVASARDSLEKIRAEFGAECLALLRFDPLEKIGAEFGAECLALHRFDPLDVAVVVVEGEPDATIYRVSMCLTGDRNGFPVKDCRSDSIFRKLARAMGYDGLDYPDDDHCLIPRPAVKDQFIPINGEAVARARRVLAKMGKPKAVLNRSRKNPQ